MQTSNPSASAQQQPFLAFNKNTRYSDIDAFASVTPDGKRIYVTLANRNIKMEYVVILSLANLAAAKNAIATVNFLIPNIVKIKESIFHQKEERIAISENHQAIVTLPPCSIARVTIAVNLDSF